jgi:hypothetical protein
MSEHTSEYQTKTEYYARRAIAEHRRVETATDARAAAVHGELAARYEALASDPSLELPGAELPDEEEPDEEMPVLRNAAG